MLALAHPMMPFVTEEIYSYLPGAGERGPEMLVVHPFPEVDEALVDEAAEREIEAAIELTRRVRRWRDLVGVAGGSVLPARVAGERRAAARARRAAWRGCPSTAPRASRWRASAGSRSWPRSEVDAEAVRRRIEERREELRAEVERAEGKLANEGFVAKAPAEVVEAEREKLAALPGRARGARRLTFDAERRTSRSLEPLGWKLRARADAAARHGARACPSTASPRSTSSAPTASPRWRR